MMINKNILIFISEKGFSGTEYRNVRTTLKKYSVRVSVFSSTNGLCVSDDGMTVKPDVLIENVHTENYIMVVLIGGQGISKHFGDEKLLKLIRKFNSEQKYIAAICGAPVLLVRAGVLISGSAVCHPAYKQELLKEKIDYSDKPVIINGRFITGRDAFASSEFVDELARIIEKLN